MSPPERMRVALAVIVAGIFLPLLSGAADAGVCTIVPIKPIHCVCGVVIDGSGGRNTNAKVTLLRGETELVSKQTAADGKFSFEPLAAGKYEIQVEATGFKTARSSLVVVKPARKCKRALEVVLGLGIECDTGIVDRYDRGDESISPPRDRFDENRVPGRIAERVAQSG